MKIAVTGKGGVGKSTITAAVALLAARQGRKVLAIDADPDANLASALGIPLTAQKAIVTIAAHKRLIEERTGAKVQQYGQIFKLNPEVADIADTYAYRHQGVALLVLGAVQKGGTGCACPENVLLRALVQDAVLGRDEVLFMDMERSIESYKRIAGMAGDIGLANIVVVGNKVKSPQDEAMIIDAVEKERLIGLIPYSERFLANDRDGRSAIDDLDEDLAATFASILDALL